MKKLHLLLLSLFVVVANTYGQAIEMTLVKGGIYNMGNERETLFEDELPVHQVSLRDFYIGVYEVSQAEWQAVMGENPSFFKGDNNPVDNVSWYDALRFCNKLSEKSGLEPCYNFRRGNTVEFNASANGYRLPTEAEWEYAARGGSLSKNYLYAGSEDVDMVGWHKGNSKGETHEGGLLQANELGLYDMSGNVWEWCWDWYASEYEQGPQTNPTGPNYGVERCRRGGGWYSVAKSSRNTNRIGTPPTTKLNYVGVRVVRNAR
ncbi:MAG: formylglycine-generating enzyme family protein [Paludibacteraceae bacterium]|nr:formylglycine-generating enzyme family protein [Paludibacteraceae bacterium]